MAEYHSEDCGRHRVYEFRRIKTEKIQFSVKAERDAAICLRFGAEQVDDEYYEIFIGCWGGDASGIRRKGDEDVVKIDTFDILSEDEFRGFWISLKRGKLMVGKRGKRLPFMTYEDPNGVIPITHYGFCTAWGADGDWIFPDGDDDESCSTGGSGFCSSDSEAEDFNNMENGPLQYKRPARWIHGYDSYLPNRAVCVGNGDSGKVYVGMAKYEGQYVLGMVVQEEGLCYIPFEGEAIAAEDYYVLSNPDQVKMSWQSASGGDIPLGALEGGKSMDGETLFIGRVKVDETISCGKVVPSMEACVVPYDGGEHIHKNYEVLCVRNVPMSSGCHAGGSGGFFG